MANFCGKCGYALDPATGKCPNCDPAPAAAETKAKDKSDKPKSKKKILIPIIAAVLVVALLAGGAVFLLPKILGNKDENKKEFITAGKDGIFITNNSGEFYMSDSGLITIEAKDDLQPLNDTNIRLSHKSVVVDNTIYAQFFEDPKIKKFDFSEGINDNTVDEDYWFNSQRNKWLILYSYDWQYCDGYIYWCSNLSDFYDSEGEEPFDGNTDVYQIMRINIDTKELETVGKDISPDSYVIYDEWIYFCETGFERNSVFDRTFNNSNAGIYRMKLDGSDKEKLLDYKNNTVYSRTETPLDSDDIFAETTPEYAYSKLGIYNNKLYYIDNTNRWDSKLYRMDLDGENVEKISDKTAYEYTIDTDTETLYYITGSYYKTEEEVKDIYEVSLNDMSNTKFAEYTDRYSRILIHAENGKLFLNSAFNYFDEVNIFGIDKPSVKGLYIDINKKEINALLMNSTYHMETFDSGRGGPFEELIIDESFFNWEKYDGDLLVLK